jgi:hypothetical protein
MSSRTLTTRLLLGMVALTALFALPGQALASPPDPSPPAIADAKPSPPPPPPEPAIRRSTVALVAAGVAVVGAGAATVFGVLALQNKSDYESHPTSSSSANANNDAAYADGCLALTVAAAVTSLLLYLTRDTTHDADPAAGARATSSAIFSAAPVVTPHGGGAGLVLRF